VFDDLGAHFYTYLQITLRASRANLFRLNILQVNPSYAFVHIIHIQETTVHSVSRSSRWNSAIVGRWAGSRLQQYFKRRHKPSSIPSGGPKSCKCPLATICSSLRKYGYRKGLKGGLATYSYVRVKNEPDGKPQGKLLTAYTTQAKEYTSVRRSRMPSKSSSGALYDHAGGIGPKPSLVARTMSMLTPMSAIHPWPLPVTNIFSLGNFSVKDHRKRIRFRIMKAYWTEIAMNQTNVMEILQSCHNVYDLWAKR
jgi:hypothetical protein